MASTETYTSEQELRNLYKGLKEEQLINLLINQHHTIRELSKNITVTHCCESDSEQLCDCAMPDPINPWDNVDKDTCRKCNNLIA